MKLFNQLILSLACITAFAQNTDSLLTVLEQREGGDRIEVLHNLLTSVWLNYPDQAMKYGEEALALSKSENDSVAISKSLRLIAGVHYYRADYEYSLEYNLRALEIATILKDSALINNGYNNIGLLYYNLGGYQTALEYLLRSKNMKAKIGETYGLPTTLNNIGLIFNRVGDYVQARKFFNDAYETALVQKDQSEVYALNNIGITFLNQQELEVAMTYFKRALVLAKKYKNINWGSVSLRGMGEIYVYKNNLDSARFYCNQSLESSESIDDKKGIVEVLTVLTKLEMAYGNTEMALFYLQKSQELADQLKLRQHLLDNLKIYVKIYEQSGEINEMINYQNRYMNLRDSLIKDVVLRNLALVPIKLKEEI